MPSGVLDLLSVAGVPGPAGAQGPGFAFVDSDVVSSAGYSVNEVLINTNPQESITIAGQIVASREAVSVLSLDPAFSVSSPVVLAGDNGRPGNKIVPVLQPADMPLSGMETGDLVLNSGQIRFTVGNILLNIGDLARVISLNPFLLTFAGNIRGGMFGAGPTVDHARHIMLVAMPKSSFLGWGTYDSMKVVGNKVVFCCESGDTSLTVYDYDTNTVVSKGSFTGIAGANYGWGGNGKMAVVGNRVVFGSPSAGVNVTFVLVYDTDTDTVSEVGSVSTSAWGAGSMAVVGNRVILTSADSSITMTIAVYDGDTNTLSEIPVPSIASWGSNGDYVVVGNRVVFTGGNASITALCVYDAETNAVSQVNIPTAGIYGRDIDARAAVGNRVVFCRGDDAAATSILVYDGETNTASDVGSFTPGIRGNSGAIAVIGNRAVIGGVSISSLLVYDGETNTVSLVGTLPNSYWGVNRSFVVMEDRVVFGSDNNVSSLVVYDVNTNTARVISAGSDSSPKGRNRSAIGVGNKAIFGSTGTGSGKIYVYAADSDTVTPIIVPDTTAVNWGFSGAVATIGDACAVLGSSNNLGRIVVYRASTNSVSSSLDGIGSVATGPWGINGSIAVIGNRVLLGGPVNISYIVVVYGDYIP